MQIDDQVHEYGRNTDTTHGLPECVSVYGIKSRLQVHKRDVQRLLEFYSVYMYATKELLHSEY